MLYDTQPSPYTGSALQQGRHTYERSSLTIPCQANTMIEKALHIVKSKKRKSISPFLLTWRDHPIGYPRLAERIAVKPETGIYRRFDALNARHILYLQAELILMEKELRELEVRDNNSKGGNRSRYAMDYKSMLEEPSSEDRLQLELLKKIQKKLRQYSQSARMP
jgi:hypothetical protein